MNVCDTNDCEKKLFLDYVSSWDTGRFDMPELRTYNLFKNQYGVEKYVKTCDKYLVSHIAQLRAGVLPLNIELGRHRQIELQDRKCVLCDYDEVEMNFILYVDVLFIKIIALNCIII